ncbi:hypothetical protein [Bacillus sp. 2205SS5-2]|uniref:hypothetical protein n=1 Tax=Bacillus sp. 2205SS5-2 TaxID=3109031 RepID=UPI00300755E9
MTAHYVKLASRSGLSFDPILKATAAGSPSVFDGIQQRNGRFNQKYDEIATMYKKNSMAALTSRRHRLS